MSATRRRPFQSAISSQLHVEQLEDRVVPAIAFFSDDGDLASDISDVIRSFQSVLGANNGVGGTFASGRREINWDGVPATFAAPNNLPADFFNVNSPRGVVFSTPGTGFQVSGANTDAGTGQPTLQFANLNAGYPAQFEPFSAQRLFSPLGSTVMDVRFFVPGTNTPATTNGFGVVFSDVDNPFGNTTTMEFFDVNDQSIGFRPVTGTGGDERFSFLGGFDNALAASIARVQITTGNRVVGVNESGALDVVVMDDFIYGEPIAVPPPPAPPTIGDIPNQTVAIGSTVGPLAFAVADAETPAGQLALTATSSNAALVANGSIAFGGSGANRTVIVNPTAGQSGTATIAVTVTDGNGQTATDSFTIIVLPLPTSPPATPPVNSPTGDLFAVATGPGVPVQVNVFEADGTLRFTLKPFDNFSGGATVATGDVTGDGIDDILVGAGAGAGPHVKLFDGATGTEIRSFFAFDRSFAGGLFVGLGDVTGDGLADLVIGAGAGGGPHVKVFDGATNAELRSFFAYDQGFTGGVSVRAGDTNADGFADIVTGAGPGGGPHIKVFSGKDGSELQSFFAGDPTFTGGVFVGIGDFKPANPLPEIVASSNGVVRVFSSAAAGLPYLEQENFTPFGPSIAAVPATIRLNDGTTAVLVGAAGRVTPHVQVLGVAIDGIPIVVRNSFFAFDESFRGGVNVG